MSVSTFPSSLSSERARPRAGERVAILGAGPAGLAVAHYLRKAGFRAVTVLERETRVGGKCCTIEHEGRSYELGAALLSPLYTHVRALVREMGIEATLEAGGVFVDDGGAKKFLLPAAARRNWRALAGEFPRYLAALLGERRLWKPGFDGLPTEMNAPFETWAKNHGYGEMVEIVRPWFTAFGYGYLDEIPAAYVLKYMTIGGFPFHELLDRGYQGLWEKVAEGLDVRLGVDVQRITRDEAGVTIDTGRDALRFDRLVLACPLQNTKSFLDASAEERRLFAKIKTIDYRVVAATVEGGPPHRYTFSDHLRSGSRGDPMFWYRRWKESDLFTFYSFGSPELTDDHLVDSIGRTLRPLGAKLGKVLRVARWDYFPHVDEGALTGGFYSSLEALQGTRRTHYAGELLAFPTVETVTAYSETVAARLLAAMGTAPAIHPRAPS
jgi:hypothetical protein